MHLIDVSPSTELRLFWWLFAARGGFGLRFAAKLHFTAGLLETLFFDPVMLVYLSVLLCFHIVCGGDRIGVASGFAAEHQLGLWKLLLADCIFAIAFGVYIGLPLLMTSHTLSLWAGVHAVGIGLFQLAMAIKLGRDPPSVCPLGCAVCFSGSGACIVFSHMEQPMRITTESLYTSDFCLRSRRSTLHGV